MKENLEYQNTNVFPAYFIIIDMMLKLNKIKVSDDSLRIFKSLEKCNDEDNMWK